MVYKLKTLQINQRTRQITVTTFTTCPKDNICWKTETIPKSKNRIIRPPRLMEIKAKIEEIYIPSFLLLSLLHIERCRMKIRFRCCLCPEPLCSACSLCSVHSVANSSAIWAERFQLAHPNIYSIFVRVTRAHGGTNDEEPDLGAGHCHQRCRPEAWPWSKRVGLWSSSSEEPESHMEALRETGRRSSSLQSPQYPWAD